MHREDAFIPGRSEIPVLYYRYSKGDVRMSVVANETRAEIDRIIDSHTLRSSEALRRLLRYLADQSLSSNADQLKEYTIGVDAFGKSANYDPREDSTVRIQVGRLRQKLAEYYQGEGKDDPILVELPKGHFKLVWSERAPAVASSPGPRSIRWYVLPLIVVLLVGSFAWSLALAAQLREARRESLSNRAPLTPELEALWAPFLATDRPLLVVVSAPLFVAMPGTGYLRDMSVNRPEQIPNSPAVTALMKALKIEHARPVYDYANFGNLTVTFLLGKLLGARKPQMSIVNSSEVTWRQLSEANLLFIGSPKFFSQPSRMPIEQPLSLETAVGVHNLHPRPGEPSNFLDETGPNASNGVTYALVSHTPGPLVNGDIESFAGSTSAGIVGAVQWFTGPSSAKTMAKILRKPSGDLMRYYQVVLKVTFQDGVPIETSYVLYRELQSPAM